MIRRAIAKDKAVLFVAHRKEIITQTSGKLDQFGISHGVVMANHPRHQPEQLVQVASIQTLTRRDKPKADLIIIDETHLACGASYQKMIEQYQGAVIIGLTATPIRLDGRGLGEIYSDIVEVVPMSQLISEGHLVKPRVFAPFTPNLHTFKTVRGDYDATQISNEMDKSSITGDIVKHWQAHANKRKTICFSSSVAHSKNIANAFNVAGISAKHLDASTPTAQRDAILQSWRDGEFCVLSNYGLFIEGLDVPAASCCILARPTKSVTIYLQAVGRVMRPHESKTDCIILDHAGLTYEHGFVDMAREWTLNGKKKRNNENIQAISVHVCESCFCAYSRHEHPNNCPECGAVTSHKERKVKKVDGGGKLVELDADTIAKLKQQKQNEVKAARTLDQLIVLGKQRGYKPAWAYRVFDERQKWSHHHARN